MPVKVPRESTGPTIVEPDSVFDDSGRFFHGYKKGKHVLPNVVVSLSLTPPPRPPTGAKVAGIDINYHRPSKIV